MSVSLKKGLFIGLFACLLLGGGYWTWTMWKASANQQIVTTDATWQPHGEGIERFDRVFETPVPKTRLVIYRVDPSRFKFRFANAGAPRLLKEWRRSEAATLVVNGVYFHEDYTPSGLLLIDGKAVAPRRFDADKSGLILFDQGIELVDTKTNERSTDGLQNAAQSYPFLIKNGAEAVTQESNLSARRSFIGVDEQGHVYLGIVPESAITLYQLSHLLQTLGIKWKSVLNLDGGPSTGLASKVDKFEESFESFTGIPNVILVEPRTTPLPRDQK